MKIILRLLGCFLLAFRWGAITRAGPRWLESWFPLLLYRSFLPESVLAFCQPGRWVTSPHLLSRLEASRFPWTATLMVLAVLVPDWQERDFPHLSSEDFFFCPFCTASWMLAWCFKKSSEEKCSFCTRHKERVFYLVVLFRWSKKLWMVPIRLVSSLSLLEGPEYPYHQALTFSLFPPVVPFLQTWQNLSHVHHFCPQCISWLGNSLQPCWSIQTLSPVF